MIYASHTALYILHRAIRTFPDTAPEQALDVGRGNKVGIPDERKWIEIKKTGRPFQAPMVTVAQDPGAR